MATRALKKYANFSAQKGRLVANEIRGKRVEEAINFLTFSNKKAAKLIKKVVDSAIANAEHNDGADIDYGFAEANTPSGVIGIKVWIFKGEVFENMDEEEAAPATPKRAAG